MKMDVLNIFAANSLLLLMVSLKRVILLASDTKINDMIDNEFEKTMNDCEKKRKHS